MRKSLNKVDLINKIIKIDDAFVVSRLWTKKKIKLIHLLNYLEESQRQ